MTYKASLTYKKNIPDEHLSRDYSTVTRFLLPKQMDLRLTLQQND